MFCFIWFNVPSVLWHCWLGHLTRKNPSPYDLYCVGGTLSLTQSIISLDTLLFPIHYRLAVVSEWMINIFEKFGIGSPGLFWTMAWKTDLFLLYMTVPKLLSKLTLETQGSYRALIFFCFIIKKQFPVNVTLIILFKCKVLIDCICCNCRVCF